MSNYLFLLSRLIHHCVHKTDVKKYVNFIIITQKHWREVFCDFKISYMFIFPYGETERANYLKFLKNHIIGKLNLDRFWLNPVIYRKEIRRKYIFLLIKLIIWTYLYSYEHFKVSILFDIAWSYRQTGVSLLWWGCFTFQLE